MPFYLNLLIFSDIIFKEVHMKLLHAADIHLGAKNSKLPLDRQNLLRSEQVLQIRELFSHADEDGFDAILICGDLFHAKKLQSKITAGFFSSVKEFSGPVLYIKGNHDEKFDFEFELPKNFIVLDENNPCFTLKNTTFWGQVAPHTIRQNYNPENQNVILLHGDFEKTNSNDYFDITKYTDNFHFDYIALGHVHTFSYKSVSGMPAVYPGSLFSNGFDECGDKGYVSVNLENKKFAFQKFAGRRYIICNCDITGFNTYEELHKIVISAIEDSGVSKSDLLRVILQGYYSENSEKYLQTLQSSLSEYFYIEIVDNSKLKIDFDKLKNEKLSFKSEFLLLLEQNEPDEQVRNEIARLGIEALRGEDIS
mgnify:FL=1